MAEYQIQFDYREAKSCIKKYEWGFIPDTKEAALQSILSTYLGSVSIDYVTKISYKLITRLGRPVPQYDVVVYDTAVATLPLHQAFRDWQSSTDDFGAWWSKWYKANLKPAMITLSDAAAAPSSVTVAVPTVPSSVAVSAPTAPPSVAVSASAELREMIPGIYAHAAALGTLCKEMSAATDVEKKLQAEATEIEAAEKELAARRAKLQEQMAASKARLAKLNAEIMVALADGEQIRCSILAK
jgi:hypothetical protein